MSHGGTYRTDPGNPPGQETEDDVEGIKTQTRFVKQESVNSTRNALRMAREAEETARNTLTRLGVIELITHFWPHTIDSLAPEQSLVDGPKPVFYGSSETNKADYVRT
jgi:hypothetical protein